MIKLGMMLGNRYEILEKIGSGGMSDVYKAKCHKLNRFVAIKVLKSEFNSDHNFISKFKSEAQSAAGLMHANIVNVYDVGDEGNIHYIVMELIEGITLKKYIEKKKRLEVRETIGIAIQVAQGIEAAHAQNIVHRDIKPQNIIISKEGKIKVTDFGIARAASTQTISSNAMGSVHYISPEQARGGYCDERSDIYSLGVTMYEMVTGRLPYEGDSTVSIALQHIQGDMKSPREYQPKIPVSLEKIIIKCTQKKAEARYLTVSELITDLKHALVAPDEDFVKIIPVMNNTSATRIMSESEVAMIKNEASRRAYQQGYEDDDEEYDEYDEEYEDEEDDVNPKFEKIMTGIGIGAAVLIVILAIYVIGSVFGLFRFSRTDSTESTATETLGEEVSMPNLLGMTFSEANEALDNLGLVLKLKYGSDSNYGEGEAIAQEYEAGTMIRQGTGVEVTFNEVIEDVIIPDNLVNLPQTSVVKTLTGMGLLTNVVQEYSDTVEEGYVIKLDPVSGTTVKAGSKVSVYVSLGKEIVENEMPDVTGMNSKEAKTLLESEPYNLNVNLTNEKNNGVSVGIVFEQSISSGSKVAEGASVTLKVSEGADLVPVPNLVGNAWSDVDASLRNLGLLVDPYYENNDSFPAGTVFYIANAGSSVESGTVIRVGISNGPTPPPETTTTEAPPPETTTATPTETPPTEPATEETQPENQEPVE